MTHTLSDDPRLVRITELCRRLPEVVRELHADYAEFRVRKKLFAYFLSNHNNDGIVAVCCKSELGENVDRASREPERFYLPRYIGKKGWFGLRVDRGPINWCEVGNILEQSYCLAAPKSLVKAVNAREAFD